MATIRSSIQVTDGMSPAFKSMNKAMNMVLSSFEAVQRASSNTIDTASIQAARAELNRAEMAFNGIEQEIKQADQAQQKFNSEINAGAGLMTKLKGLAAGLGVAFGAKQIIALSDQMTSTTARLNLMNDGLQTTAELQDMIMKSAQRSRAAYMDTANVVSKLGILAGHAFSNNEEMVAFAEQMNKQFKVGGASVQEQTAAMYQLTQAMASGRLQGDEFRSIMENAPLLAQSIAEYMGKSVGELREMSSQGLITADVIKNAMFASAEATNAKFAEMPMTFTEVGTMISNILLETFEPLIQAVGRGAQFIYDNWSSLEPLFLGLAVAVGAYTVGLGYNAAATWIATGAAKAFFTTLLSNPLFWIALAIGVVVGAIYKWVQSVGGIHIAWLTVMDAIQTATGNAKVGVLYHLEQMLNGSIDLLNRFIEVLNRIPGVNIGTVDRVNFAAKAAIENEAAKSARREEIYAARMEIIRGNAEAGTGFDWGNLTGGVESTAGNTAKIANTMDAAEEDLKYMRDLAEQEVINRFTTAEIRLEMTNNNSISSNMDLDGMVTYLAENLYETMVTASEGVHE